jgi:twitching motility protein PilT
MQIDIILQDMINKHASDLHIKPGRHPTYRINGVYQESDFPILNATEVRELIGTMTDDRQKQMFDEEKELDFAYTVPHLARFRVNVYLQSGNLACSMRMVPLNVLTIDELGLPQILKKLSEKPRGLILVTGPTGSGKSTTIAAMIDHINTTRRTHIITIEDPVEFIHKDKLAVVDQREIGRDTQSFGAALKRVLRQDPDVIVIGEIRDLETISIAVTAAETGHLVFATLHTSSAAQTIDRVVDVFPHGQQQQIRSQLSLALEGVICQILVPRADGNGRIPAFEIMTTSNAIKSQIRENEIALMSSTIMTSKNEGMITLDSYLTNMVERNEITYDVAISKASNQESFKKLFLEASSRKR